MDESGNGLVGSLELGLHKFVSREVVLKGRGFSRAAQSQKGFGLLAPEGAIKQDQDKEDE